MELKPAQLSKEWSSGKLRPAYYLSGEETWLKTQALQELKEHLKATEFDFQAWEGNTLSVVDLLSAAKTPPLFSPLRLLVIKRAELMNAACRSSVAEYFHKPLSSTCLIFLAEERKSSKDPLVSQILAKGALVTYWPLKEPEAISWVENELKKAKSHATPEALRTLIQAVGTNLAHLHQELSKLLLYTREQKEPIREDQILSSLGHQTEGNIFDLGRDVQMREFSKAMERLQTHLDHGQEPLLLLHHIASSLGKLLKAKSLLRKGTEENQIFRTLGISAFFNKDFVRWAQKWKEEELRETLKRCLETEGRLKSASHILSARVELELLLGRWLEKSYATRSLAA